MILRKIYIILTALILISANVTAIEDTVSVAVINFAPLQNVRAIEAFQISEVIRSEIIKSEYIKSIESDQMEKIDKEIKFQGTGMTENMIIDIGKKLNAQYLLLGSFGSSSDQLIVTARLVSAKTGENLDAWNLHTTRNLITKELPELADSITTSILTSSLGNNLKNVMLLIERGEITEAAVKYKLYKRTHSESPEMKKVEKKLYAGLAAYHYNHSKKFLSANMIRDAYQHAGESVNLEPGNESYHKQYREVLERFNALRKKEYNTFISKIEDLVSQREYSKARKTINAYLIAEGGRYLDERYFKLINKIKEGSDTENCDKAESILDSLPSFLSFRKFDSREHRYYLAKLSEAKEILLNVLAEKPEHGRAISLLEKTNKSIGYVTIGYESNVKEDTSSLYSDYKWHINAGLLFQDVILAPSPLAPDQSLSGFIFNGGIRNLSNPSITMMFHSSLTYASGSESRFINGSGYDLSFRYCTLSLGVLPGLKVDSFTFFAGPHIQTGVLVRTTESTDKNDESVPTGISLTFGVGYDLRAEWQYDVNLFGYASYEYTTALGLGMPETIDSRFSLGFGYLF